MKKYERNVKYSTNSIKDPYSPYNSEKNKEEIKPLYYNDYYITDITSKNNKYICLVSILLSIFVFTFSLSDLVYSYIKIDKCQEISYFTTLNDWLRVNGIFGICYYFFIMIIISSFYYEGENHISNGYTKMSIANTNNHNKNNNDNCELLHRVCSTFFTVIMLLLFCIGSYIYFSFFYSYCTSYAIIIYMWTRLITGILSSIGIIVFINFCK